MIIDRANQTERFHILEAPTPYHLVDHNLNMIPNRPSKKKRYIEKECATCSFDTNDIFLAFSGLNSNRINTSDALDSINYRRMKKPIFSNLRVQNYWRLNEDILRVIQYFLPLLEKYSSYREDGEYKIQACDVIIYSTLLSQMSSNYKDIRHLLDIFYSILRRDREDTVVNHINRIHELNGANKKDKSVWNNDHKSGNTSDVSVSSIPVFYTSLKYKTSNEENEENEENEISNIETYTGTEENTHSSPPSAHSSFVSQTTAKYIPSSVAETTLTACLSSLNGLNTKYVEVQNYLKELTYIIAGHKRVKPHEMYDIIFGFPIMQVHNEITEEYIYQCMLLFQRSNTLYARNTLDIFKLLRGCTHLYSSNHTLSKMGKEFIQFLLVYIEKGNLEIVTFKSVKYLLEALTLHPISIIGAIDDSSLLDDTNTTSSETESLQFSVDAIGITPNIPIDSLIHNDDNNILKKSDQRADMVKHAHENHDILNQLFAALLPHIKRVEVQPLHMRTLVNSFYSFRNYMYFLAYNGDNGIESTFYPGIANRDNNRNNSIVHTLAVLSTKYVESMKLTQKEFYKQKHTPNDLYNNHHDTTNNSNKYGHSDNTGIKLDNMNVIRGDSKKNDLQSNVISNISHFATYNQYDKPFHLVSSQYPLLFYGLRYVNSNYTFENINEDSKRILNNTCQILQMISGENILSEKTSARENVTSSAHDILHNNGSNENFVFHETYTVDEPEIERRTIEKNEFNQNLFNAVPHRPSLEPIDNIYSLLLLLHGFSQITYTPSIHSEYVYLTKFVSGVVNITKEYYYNQSHDIKNNSNIAMDVTSSNFFVPVRRIFLDDFFLQSLINNSNHIYNMESSSMSSTSPYNSSVPLMSQSMHHLGVGLKNSEDTFPMSLYLPRIQPSLNTYCSIIEVIKRMERI